MSTLTYNEYVIPDKIIDLNDSNSDNTITNSFHSTQATPILSQEVIYQQPLTYSMSCDELKKKLQKENSNDRMNSSPDSLQLKSNNNPKINLTESPASVSTITTSTTTTSKSSEHSKSDKGSKSSKSSSPSNFNSVAILGQPIILTPENKKLLKKLRKGEIKNAPKLAIISNPAFPTPLFSKKTSQESIVSETARVLSSNNNEEEKEVDKKEKEKEEASEEEEIYSFTSENEGDDDEEIDNNDFSHIIVGRDDSDEEEEDDDVDKEITYPMRAGFILRDDDDEEEENQDSTITTNSNPGNREEEKEKTEEEKEKTDQKKETKMDKKAKLGKKNKKSKESGSLLLEEKNSEESVTETEKATGTIVEPSDLSTINHDIKRMSIASLAASDTNYSFYSLPAGGLSSSSCLSVQKAATEVSSSIASNLSSIDPNSSYYIPSPGLGVSVSAPTERLNGSGAPIDTNTSFWVPPPPSQTDTTQLVVNIQGHQVPIEKIQQAYSFLRKNHIQQNENPIAEKLKSINNTQKLVSFNLQEKTTMPHSAMVKNVPPVIETTGQPKGTAGVPSKTSRILKAKQSLDTAAVKRQSWCNVNSDILGNLQLSNQRSSSYPQLSRIGFGPLVNLPMNQLLHRNYSGTPNVNNNMNLPNPALINIPYGTIINNNAYTTHNSINPHTKKDEKGEEREDRQRVERVERWAQESKATMCPIKENKTFSSKSRRASTTLLKVPISYVNAIGKKSKSFDNIKQIYSIEDDSTPLALVRGRISNSSGSSSSSSSDDDVPLQMIVNSSSKHSSKYQASQALQASQASQGSQTARVIEDSKKRHSLVLDDSKKRHSLVLDDSKKRHSLVLDDSKKRHSLVLDDSKKRHSLVLDDSKKRHSFIMDDSMKHRSMIIDDNMKHHNVVMNPVMDSSMRHHDHRHSQIYGPPSPNILNSSMMGPVEVISVPPTTSKKNKRRSYAPGMVCAEHPEYRMNYAANGGYYQGVPVQPNPYGLKYGQGQTHAHTHTHQYATGHANPSRAYYQNPGHHSRMYM